VGVWLLYKGLRLLSLSLDKTFASWLMGGGLLVGFIKGRFVLSKTVQRIVKHIASAPEPISFRNVYPKSYLLLLASMMCLGFVLRFVPIEWRGFIDIAVGSALMNGAMLYFRAARSSLMV
ncbi:MAG TPA: hypothetical protein VGM34_02370, partial [Chlamydiales bacterium]